MVSIIENWAVIVGVVLGIAQVDPDSGLRDVTLQIEEIRHYEDFPMVLTQQPEDQVVVRVNTGQLPPGECLVGERLTIRVRRGSKAELLFAHPEWTAAPAR